MSYHQLREHVVQLIVSWHGQRWLHGLQGKILPQPVGDLRVIAAVKTAEDEGETAIATATAFSRSHGCRNVSSWSGREGGRLPLGLFTASSTSECGLRQRLLWTNRRKAVSLFSNFRKISLHPLTRNNRRIRSVNRVPHVSQIT